MIPFFILLFLSGLVIYGWLIEKYRKAWTRLSEFTAPTAEPHSSIAVVIAARNEEEHIPALLNALSAQQYPTELWEVIIIDDQSTDRTYDLLSAYTGPIRLKLLRLAPDTSRAHKKRALEAGIEQATAKLIVTTDADCIFGPLWLHTIAAFYEHSGRRCIAAPVQYLPAKNPLAVFQTLDFITLQGITGASLASGLHLMSNGANFIFERDVFFEVGGYAGIDSTPSGDDMLLMQKIERAFPGSTAYLKSRDAIVYTHPMPTLRSFLNQRIRWASKTGSYRDKNTFRILLLVYLLNLFFLILTLLVLADPFLIFLLLLFLVAKVLIEYPFVALVAKFFGSAQLMKWFLPMQPLHIMYTVLAGFMGRFGSYKWKDRKISKAAA